MIDYSFINKTILVCFIIIIAIGDVNAQIDNVKKQKRKGEFILATWNIGHFALGNNVNSLIRQGDYAEKKTQYRHLVYDSIAPDIICLNEYSEYFIKDSKEYKADAVIFDIFTSKLIGEQRNYSCNAVYSNLKIRDVCVNDFASSQRYLANDSKANQYYFVSAKLTVNRKKIHLICTHLYPWNGEIRDKQIAELIEKYKEHKRVIICGDLNTTNFKSFAEAGFSLSNNGNIVTYPISKAALDNIITKGVRIRDVQVVKTDLSDHYPLVCILSTK